MDIDKGLLINYLNNETELFKTVEAISVAIRRSIEHDQTYNTIVQPITRDEIRRRTQMCIEWLRRARAEHGFSVIKTLDLMPHALLADIAGHPFDPATLVLGNMWSPT